jgi:hypothetical protein
VSPDEVLSYKFFTYSIKKDNCCSPPFLSLERKSIMNHNKKKVYLGNRNYPDTHFPRKYGADNQQPGTALTNPTEDKVHQENPFGKNCTLMKCLGTIGIIILSVIVTTVILLKCPLPSHPPDSETETTSPMNSTATFLSTQNSPKHTLLSS